jgi:hypothetical protein
VRRRPLGLRPTIRLSQARLRKLRGIETLDLSLERFKVRYDLAAIGVRVRLPLAEREFRRFLALKLLFPKEKAAPWLAVDSYWHQFILNTVKYREFCDRTFGHYFDHTPGQPGGSRVEFLATLSRTRRLLRRTFGSAPKSIWGTDATTT